MADALGYDPSRSKVSDSTMTDFLRSQITGDVTEVPGIGPAAKRALAGGDDESDRITNTFQLIGKFLMLKGPDEDDMKIDCMEHMEKFWYWLKQKGIKSHRSAIVKAIGEKINTMIPGIYDASIYAEDDDDEDDDE
uniref:Uncharacterized protein n=1 Tax=Eucampia antarctica TaxID=49252 RepID=A0A7S2R0A3_9STRA|mmetsp:Transcript_11298/g.10811  ORF Transcript_11298/g.10811 Transcript_11298/m.10811 type:complete len:136 (+) Transcript_11298:83-490(+)|eukprot:CAMPEP_0197836838 /NCGR_PEP_ID=MMETSP1437-20131217/30226_1 /TAXON_ID=49252 ORGANISM="Eucampia antarctica, Strain CCMP1452" /NCGR_SAMPLE_ID=MMETSP1437 /ASSEMBLY_ACC=CAM_ASM_001096 /LENGTH=135 /DNA_ID=CAMNT_0043443343 /DNA_START=66 /DNA_END=473 /DNA_ORIENTATION=+